MSRPVARLGDITIGKCRHPLCAALPVVYGKIVTVSPNKNANTRGVARIGDIVLCENGHTGTIITGDARLRTNNRDTARVGDQFYGVYEGVILTGSPSILVGSTAPAAAPVVPEETDNEQSRAVVEGDELDSITPGAGREYSDKLVEYGILDGSEVAEAVDILQAAPPADETPPGNVTPATVLSCDELFSLNPFPSGGSIDLIQLTEQYTIGMVTRSPHVVFDYPLRENYGGLTIAAIACNLKNLVSNCVEPIKARFPSAIITNSFRPKGSGQHTKGQACDIQFKGVPPEQYYEIAQWIRDNVPFDQLLLEYKTTGTKLPWIHISFNSQHNRSQVMTFMNHQKHSNGLTQLA